MLRSPSGAELPAALALQRRRRYVDLWSSEGVSDVFVKRAHALSWIRRHLESEGYLLPDLR